jgi:hypothetical protein
VTLSFTSLDGQFQSCVLTPKGQEILNAYKEYSKARQHAEKRFNDVATKRKILEQPCLCFALCIIIV